MKAKAKPNLQQVFAKNVRILLAIRGWKQKDLAKRTGYCTSYMSTVLGGHRGVNLEMVEAFSKAFGVESASLLKRREEP